MNNFETQLANEVIKHKIMYEKPDILPIKLPNFNKGKILPQFSVLSYNILADAYKQYSTDGVSPTYLNFNYRSKIILAELKQLLPDIFFMQEVDNFENTYQKPLKEMGYQIHFLYRKNSPDGNAVGFKTNKFEFLKEQKLTFDQGHPFTNNWDFCKGSGAVFLSLKHKETGKIINVLGTHLFWDSKKEQIKYTQMYVVMKYFEENLDSNSIIIWGGDLNSSPDDNTCTFITQHAKPSLNRMYYQNQEGFKVMNYLYELLYKNWLTKIKFDSVYEQHGKATGKENETHPSYTYFSNWCKGVADHIFYTSKQIEPISLLKIPDNINDLACPNQRHPSDHFPLYAIFQFKQQN